VRNTIDTLHKQKYSDLLNWLSIL